MLEEHNCQSRIIYPMKIFFKNEAEINIQASKKLIKFILEIHVKENTKDIFKAQIEAHRCRTE